MYLCLEKQIQVLWNKSYPSVHPCFMGFLSSLCAKQPLGNTLISQNKQARLSLWRRAR